MILALGTRPFTQMIVFDEAHKYMGGALIGQVVEVIREMRHKGLSVVGTLDQLTVGTGRSTLLASCQGQSAKRGPMPSDGSPPDSLRHDLGPSDLFFLVLA